MLTEQRTDRAVQQERTDAAFRVAEPAQNPRIAPRLIPIVLAVLVGIGVIVALFLNWGGGS